MSRSSVSKFMIILSLFWGGRALAGSDHPHAKGPHGGTVEGFGEKYHMEAVRLGDTVTFYLLGGDGESSATIAKHKGGSITLVSPGKGAEKTEIPPGGPFSEASATASGKGKITATIKLKVDGSTASAKFSLKK